MQTIHLTRAARKRDAKSSSDPILRPGSSFCRCAECGEVFRGVRAFERHRVGRYDFPGDRGCATTPRMPGMGLQIDANGVWAFPKRAFSPTKRHEIDVKRGRAARAEGFTDDTIAHATGLSKEFFWDVIGVGI